MALDKLPKEVLQEIIKYLAPGHSNYLNCSLTCRSLWAATTAALYRNVNLAIEERFDEEADEKTARRQLQFIESIAKNPMLGAHVRSFSNYNNRLGDVKDVTQSEQTDRSLLTRAAENMRFLSKASFTANPLAFQVIMKLPSYPQLYDLILDGIAPDYCIWRNAPTSIRNIKWKIPSPGYGSVAKSLWDSPKFIFRVIEATCSDLETLDISFCGSDYIEGMDTVTPSIIEEYQALPENTGVKIARLRHFGYTWNIWPPYVKDDSAETSFILSFIAKHGKSLQSLRIPVNMFSWNNDTLNFTLKVCSLVPELRELTLSYVKHRCTSTADMTSMEFFHALTTSPATARIERFSTQDIHHCFSKEIGQAFRSWKNLKFLRVGDEDNLGGAFGNDGRLQFDNYRPQILGFVEGLPPSIQELILEINGDGLWLDEDEDFDPVCDMAAEIFASQPRLHTCDIHAWISDRDGGLGSLPEKCVFYRRLPGSEESEKTLWTSRMDCIYQEEDILVKKSSSTLQSPNFVGEDAEEAWLDGFEFHRESQRGVTGRGRPEKVVKPDFTWPFYKNKIASYELWNEER
ncbi:hypothetical protein JHW43_006146 [Diplocarpon mali]|nr:hypothetical protein JHW43_006146 [Diplocarpon mali]